MLINDTDGICICEDLNLSNKIRFSIAYNKKGAYSKIISGTGRYFNRGFVFLLEEDILNGTVISEVDLVILIDRVQLIQ